MYNIIEKALLAVILFGAFAMLIVSAVFSMVIGITLAAVAFFSLAVMWVPFSYVVWRSW